MAAKVEKASGSESDSEKDPAADNVAEKDPAAGDSDSEKDHAAAGDSDSEKDHAVRLVSRYDYEQSKNNPREPLVAE